MQRGLAGSEQGTATEQNSAGTCQPLMHGEGTALVPSRTNWELGIKQVLWESRKSCGWGCRLAGRMRAARASSALVPALPTTPSWTGSSSPRPSSGHTAKEALTDLRDVCRNLMDMMKIRKDSKYLTAINPSGRESILEKKK